MASQSPDEEYTATAAPAADGEPPAGAPSGSSPDPKVDSREILERPGDQAESQDPGSQDNQPPQDPNPGPANVDGTHGVLGLSFPRKLWMIVEDEAFTSVRWNDKGDMLIIEEDLFQREVLRRRGADRIFETDSLKSFIRQLNLYGFRKIHLPGTLGRSPGKKRLMIYHNCNFQREKPLLIENMRRKGDPRATARPASSTTTPKRKKQAVPPMRCTQFFHQNDSTNDADRKTQREAPRAQVPSGFRAFVLPGVLSAGRVARLVVVQRPSSEQGGPSGEGTSRNVTLVPPATAGRDGAGELPRSPPVCPDPSSVVSTCNTGYCMLLAALLLMAPNQRPEADEEPEGSSDYKCALCEQFQNNPKR
ncbi:LOW QUALITY PROTEIN: heat shock transcription factor, X-linked member 3-like [Camelus ferus]|uniref:LOW QUALITY PROTEIN: heat shock transcription factor, X-linked member 3-like n=3 Tax=Camelus TaxID=9836 RepID=A0A8B8SLT1_CAMFR|nr:LOW QUALITY PROTEIN: heat shock transcription factor, X-linked member 3-like [Camelus ferus]XP_032331588.1 LOW QUALITY PROTEIN: heat shock transcription factor, X-linked member 3-like [Camelus ferus]